MSDRLDEHLVALKLVETRSQAKALILAGKVKVNGQTEFKAGKPISSDMQVELVQNARFVSRAGEKLESALKAFQYNPRNKVVLDIGASTGGFTDCLLQSGAAYVVAIDVGYGQMAWSIRQNEKVLMIERFNARYLTPSVVEGWGAPMAKQINLVVMDVSFISILKIIPAVLNTYPSFDLISLIKPQFEVGRALVGKRGIVKDPKVHEDLLETMKKKLTDLGFQNLAFCPAGIKGTEGNQEFFVFGNYNRVLSSNPLQ